MKKFTKKQLEVINNLIMDIGELENKPRRLFYALESFAFAFGKDDAVPSIREAQDLMYRHINEGSHYSELFNTLREFIIEEWEHQIRTSPKDISSAEASIYSAECFVKKHISRLTKRRLS